MWLLRAYFKRWGKLIFIYFALGLTGFFLLVYAIAYFAPHIPVIHKTNIGVVGNINQDALPDFILNQLSRGLTKVSTDGTVQPDIALSWSISNGGKTYTIHLPKNISFSDGNPLTSSTINIPFSDVHVQTPNDTTLIFTLKDVYAPFLSKISFPLFEKGHTLVGIKDTQVRDIKYNGSFITSITLAPSAQPYNLTTYNFYPTQEALKIALVLGDVSEAIGITDTSFRMSDLQQFPNLTITKSTDYSQLVTLFFNTQDKSLSDKRLRTALTLTLPDSFTAGQSATGPYPPTSWAYSLINPQIRDSVDGTKLFQDAAGQNADLTLTTLTQYQPIAQDLVDHWNQLNIHVKLVTSDTIPATFQMLLGSFNEPKDPDQYALWHSNETNNISRYNNERIDKLLEDGRQNLDEDTRLKTYTDFQKYLTDDPPAAFLYFPYVYTVTRK